MSGKVIIGELKTKAFDQVRTRVHPSGASRAEGTSNGPRICDLCYPSRWSSLQGTRKSQEVDLLSIIVNFSLLVNPNKKVFYGD